ncbi:MAG: carboxypeptidase regulatory-like domain-containing protein, partial [Planctomycetes bacterium]|nr:carboxypeptidase regulatory-like domain-containing protein [Planctomycetota bacterium]
TAEEPPPVRQAAPTTGALDVQVVWASDHRPAPGLEVVVSVNGPSDRVKGRTDERGQVKFAALAPGGCRLYASQATPPQLVKVDVIAGVTQSCELAVGGDQRLVVTVVDEREQSQAGADVWCGGALRADDGPFVIGQTDAAGRLAYRGLPLRAIWARCAGRQPSLRHDLPRSRPSQLPPPTVEVGLVLGGIGCAVLGTVVDPAGRAVPGAQVVIACEDQLTTGPERPSLTLAADADGRFRCDEVPVGERYIVAEASGFAPAIDRLSTSADQPASIVLALRTGATLTGRVTEADGTAAVGLTVQAARARLLPGIGSRMFGWTRTAQTDGDGRYRLEAILPGEIHARVAVEPEIRQSLTLADGQLCTWDAQKQPERAISGTVRDPDGAPLANWMVRARANVRTRSGEHTALTDANGAFRIAGLDDVPHRLFVFAGMRIGARSETAAMVPRVVLEDVKPSAEPLTIRLDAQAMASGRLEGSIAMPDGIAAKAVLSLYAKALRGGAFSVPQQQLDPGQTTVTIGPLPSGDYDLLCDIEGRGRLALRDVHLAAGESLRLPPFAADAQRPLLVALRDADGRAVTGAKVMLKQTHDPCAETEAGRYATRPIEFGAYDVLVRGAGFAPDALPVQFAGQQQPFELTVRPAADVTIVCRPPTPRDRWVGALQVKLIDANGADVVQDIMQIDGRSEFAWSIGLLPGTYSLRCAAFSDGSASTTFTVGDAAMHVDMQLTR